MTRSEMVERRLRAETIVALIGLLIVIALCGVGCSLREINTPTQASSTKTVSVTVRALVYQSSDPIAQVGVYADDRLVGTTDIDGVAHIMITGGREVTIKVARPGWQPLMPWAAGTVDADGEIWTFYLERVQ